MDESISADRRGENFEEGKKNHSIINYLGSTVYVIFSLFRHVLEDDQSNAVIMLNF